MPGIRKRVRADLRLEGLPRDKVVAAIVSLLEKTFIRIGNESYARENGSFGLTTLRNRHVKLHGDRIRFQFRSRRHFRLGIQAQPPSIMMSLRRGKRSNTPSSTMLVAWHCMEWTSP